MDIFEQTRIQSLHFVMYSIILEAQIHFIIYEFRIYFFVQDKIIRRIANVNMFSLHIIFRAYKDVMMEWLVFKLYQNRYTIRYKMRLSIVFILNHELIVTIESLHSSINVTKWSYITLVYFIVLMFLALLVVVIHLCYLNNNLDGTCF